MDINLGELYCDRGVLLNLLIALKAIRPSSIRVESKYGAITIRGTNAKRTFSMRGCNDNVLVSIPYGGAECGGFVKPKPFLQAISDAEDGGVARVPVSAQPLGWQEDYYKFDPKKAKPYDGSGLYSALDFLLRLDPFSQRHVEYAGVLCRDHELLVTDQYRMHIHQGLEPLTPYLHLWGGDSAACLYKMFGVLPSSSLRTYYSAPDTLFFDLRDESGIGVVVYSHFRLNSSPDDTPFEARIPIDGNAIGFAVHGEFLMSVLQATLNASKGVPSVVLRAGDGQLHYQAFDTPFDDPEGAKKRELYRGEIPMVRSLQTVGDVEILLDAVKLKEAVEGRGESVQFIIPCHPQFGFEYYSVSPVYVNCNPQQFAVIMPMTTDPSGAEGMRRRYKEAHATVQRESHRA